MPWPEEEDEEAEEKKAAATEAAANGGGNDGGDAEGAKSKNFDGDADDAAVVEAIQDVGAEFSLLAPTAPLATPASRARMMMLQHADGAFGSGGSSSSQGNGGGERNNAGPSPLPSLAEVQAELSARGTFALRRGAAANGGEEEDETPTPTVVRASGAWRSALTAAAFRVGPSLQVWEQKAAVVSVRPAASVSASDEAEEEEGARKQRRRGGEQRRKRRRRREERGQGRLARPPALAVVLRGRQRRRPRQAAGLSLRLPELI